MSICVQYWTDGSPPAVQMSHETSPFHYNVLTMINCMSSRDKTLSALLLFGMSVQSRSLPLLCAGAEPSMSLPKGEQRRG